MISSKYPKKKTFRINKKITIIPNKNKAVAFGFLKNRSNLSILLK